MKLQANGTWMPFPRLPVPIIGHAWAPVMEIWELSSWDPYGRKYVPDSNGSLRMMGYTDHIVEAPPRYRGPIPTPETIAFITKSDNAHKEWAERRAEMIAEQ